MVEVEARGRTGFDGFHEVDELNDAVSVHRVSEPREIVGRRFREALPRLRDVGQRPREIVG